MEYRLMEGEILTRPETFTVSTDAQQTYSRPREKASAYSAFK